MELTFVTGNLGKLKEAEQILGIKLNHAELDLHEIQEVKVECVVEHKARKAYELLKKPVIVDDSSLGFDAFNGYPGALIKWTEDYLGIENICKILNGFNRGAVVKCAIGFYNGKELKIFVGENKGTIVEKPRGKEGFGFDFIFQPEGYKRTFAEMSREEKNKISSRSIALKKLKEFVN